jgi:predicted RNA-binding protein with PIN domain
MSGSRSRWLVDGMNVIGSRPDGWWRDRDAAMRRLVERLERFARDAEEAVTVVFDSRPRDLDEESEDVRVLFAGRSGRDAADEDIVRIVRQDPDPGSLQVVTSDRALSDNARRAGAHVISSGSFLRRLT